MLARLSTPVPAAPAADAKLDVGMHAPSITLTNQDGKQCPLADRKGKGWTELAELQHPPKEGSKEAAD